MPSNPYKLYDNPRWLYRQFYVLKKSPKEIALAAGCSEITIRRKLKKIGYMK